MQPCLTSRQMREADRIATEQLGIPEIVLMEHAALALVESLETRFRQLLPHTRGVVVAGPGNNGGDVLAAARILLSRGCKNIYISLRGQENKLSPSCAVQSRILSALGARVGHVCGEEWLAGCDWVLDGLFGTGLARPVEGPHREVIELVNRFSGRKWIVSADIPSGLNADTGQPLGVAVKASETVTFGFQKRGLVTGEAANYVGKLKLACIQIGQVSLTEVPDVFLYSEADARLPPRGRAGNKGDYGHVYVWAGEPEKQGASIMSGIAALRAGCGLVSLVGSDSRLKEARPRLPPEIMTRSLNNEELRKSRDGEVLVMGPGMGTEANNWPSLAMALGSEFPVVLDGDALTLLAGNRTEAKRLLSTRKNVPTVLTPHPKEAARLLGVQVPDIQADRFAACRALAREWSAALILKGKGTVIGEAEGNLVVTTAGDSSLSKGGTGDILTGIVASFLAQRLGLSKALAGRAPLETLALAAFVHGRAAELLSQSRGEERSAFAGEIAGYVSKVFEELERWKRK